MKLIGETDVAFSLIHSMNTSDTLRTIHIKWNEKKSFGVDDIDVQDSFVSSSSINTSPCVIHTYIQVCSRDALDGTRMFVRVEMREDAGALNQLIFKGLADEGRLGDARRGTVVNGQPGKDVVVKVRDVLIGHTLKAL